MTPTPRTPTPSPRGGVTSLGLPYPDPTDPVNEGAANIRALAEAVEGLYLIGEAVLDAPGVELRVEAIPQHFHTIACEVAIVPTGNNNDVSRYSFYRTNMVGGEGEPGILAVSGNTGNQGFGPGVSRTTEGVPFRAMYHGANQPGPTKPTTFGRIVIPFYSLAQRHCYELSVIGKSDVSGNPNTDYNFLTGVYSETEAAGYAFTPIDGVLVKQTAGSPMGVGSRLAVYGLGSKA